MKKIIVLLLLIVSTFANAQDSVLLRYNYNKGEKYVTVIDTNQEIPFVGKMKMKMYMLMNIVDIKDDVYKINISFDRVISETESTKYDSDMKLSEMSEDAKQMHEKMKPMLAMVIEGKKTKRGEMSDLKIIKGEGNIETIKSQMNQNLTFPVKPVKVGDSWSISNSQKIYGMTLNYEYSYKVISIKNNTVDVGISGKVSGVALGDISGSGIVDSKTGVSTLSKIFAEMSMMGQKMKSNAITKTTKK